jgi:hypothetical protein
MNQQMIDHGSYLQVRGLQLGLLRRPTASNRLRDSVALWQIVIFVIFVTKQSPV